MSHAANSATPHTLLEDEFVPPLDLVLSAEACLISWDGQLAAICAWQAAGGNADRDGATREAIPPRIERRHSTEHIAFADRRRAA